MAMARPFSSSVITAAVTRKRGTAPGSTACREGWVAASTARQGLTAAAQSAAEMPARLLPRKPAATISPTASHKTRASTVMARAWKVFSRHRAKVEPRLPQAATQATVTASTRAIWPVDTPPSKAAIMNSGKAAASRTNTPRRLAASFPTTNSPLDRWVSRRRTRV